LTVADEGTYTVNTTTGVVTFDPLPTFTGTASPVKYVVADNFGQKTSATITPTVSLPDPPTAANNTSSGDFDTNQTIRPVTNDSAGSGASLVASSVRLCATTSTANAVCRLTSLTVPGEGTYTVNTTTGVVTFDPLPTFTGTASPVKYVVADVVGQIVHATITPTVGEEELPPTGINAMEKLVVSVLLLLTIGLGLNRAKFWAS
jgi:CshA-type fibril repeat protein